LPADRISAPANRPRLEADHAAQADMSGTDISIRHAHEPIDAAALIAVKD
jgi:hypothetical protein